MGWEDRPYYRDRSYAGSGVWSWLWSGSVPLFTVFGIRVRAHASLLLFIALTIALGGLGNGRFEIQYRVVTMSMLFVIVLLHEFGHCFAARWVEGSADEIVMTPLGGFASADPPRRAGAAVLTVAAGPIVNVAICALAGAAIYYTSGHRLPPLNPLNPLPAHVLPWRDPALYLWAAFIASYFLLLFNLLPIYPLDGGQLLQAILWPVTGYARSINIATMVGMVGSIGLMIIGIVINWWIILIAISCFLYCRQKRLALAEGNAEEWQDSIDYSASLFGGPHEEPPRRRKRLSRRAIAKARKIARREAAEQERIDLILSKVSARGMHSLNWRERRALHKETEKQRRRDLELSRLK